MSKYLSSRHEKLAAYVPGEQPADMQYIKLNTNESPYPPPPGVIAAVNEDELKRLRLYPNPDGTRLIEKLAKFYGVGNGNVIIGNGSDELLAFAFLAFCDNERGIAFPDITYGFYPVYAELFDIPYEKLPLKEDFAVDPADYMGIGKNIVLASPNSPTGVAIPKKDIEAIVQSNPGNIVIVDEAYAGFGAESAIALTAEYDNLLMVYTYSKSRSLAGARMAFAIGPEPLIGDLNKMKYSFNPYNVNRLTQVMAEAALDEEEYYTEKRREIIATRSQTVTKLKALGFSTTDSKANFIFVRHPGITGYELYSKLKEKGVLVRQWNKPRIADHLRITIGTGEQMGELIRALEEILPQEADRTNEKI